MEIKDIQKKAKSEQRKINVNIKISQTLSKWIHENNISPTSLFHKACEELGYKEEENN